LSFSCFAIAQQAINKVHYRVINESFESSLKYEKALEHTFLDNLRYLDSRRQIQVEGTQISIELFSAEELLASYGKPISPLTARKSAVAVPVKFNLSRSNYSLLTTSANQIENGQRTTANIKLSPKETITNFGNLSDKGGLSGNYSNNETYTKTIYSDNGESPYLNFTLFDVENHFDVMYIYDGPSATSKLIGAYSGGVNPKIVKASGAYLTVVFTSDANNNRQGWNALVGRGVPHIQPSPMAATDSCSQAAPFCANIAGSGGITFPAATDGTNTAGSGPSAQPGPSYGCLSSTPNPAWYYLQVANAGTLVLTIAGSASNDVDFICWGPFTSPTAPCATGLTGACSSFGTPTNTTNAPCSGNIVDCSYSTSPTETCTINNATVGQYYLILITNFEDMPQNINLNQTGGNGSTNCNIVTCGITASNTGPYCVGQTISLGATTTNTTATTYSWSGPGGFTSTLQNPTIANSTAAMSGTYSVTGTTGGTVTCTETTTVSVTSSAVTNVTTSTVCAGGTGTLTASGTSSYTWSTGATTATLTDNPATTTVYTVTGGVGTCTSTATSTISVVSNPAINVNSATICTGNTATLTANGVTSYNWSPPTGLSSTTTSAVTANPASTIVYTITGSVGTCVAPPVTTTVTVISAIVPTVTSNTPCANQTLSLNCNPGSYTNYAWAGSGGYSSAVQNPTRTGVTAAAAGIYTLVVTDASNCINAATINVIINPLPVVTASASPACLNTSLNLYASGGVAYSWSGQSGAYTSSLQNPIIANATASASGVYVVTVTDANGCVNANSTLVSVYPLPLVAVNDTNICLLTTGTLTASGAQNYSWSPGTDLNTIVGNTVLVTPSTLATTVYTVTGQDARGCTNTATAIVMVSALPTVSVTPALTKGCVPQCATYTVTGDSVKAYDWSFGNGQTSTSSSPNVCFTTANNYTVKLTVTDTNGCKNTAKASVVTYPIPIADFDYSPKPITILEPKVSFFNETYGANIVGYAWNFGENVAGDSSMLKDPVHTYLNIGTYPVTLIASSSNGCKDTIVKNVIIEQDYVLYVPTAFSPNGDGKNETFKPEGEGITDFKMYIFDRWGNKIFTTDDIDIGWDGRRNNKGGDALQEDVYVWKIDLRNVSHQGKTYSGTVTLLK
jgi:gliding motility-associated-like protein